MKSRFVCAMPALLLAIASTGCAQREPVTREESMKNATIRVESAAFREGERIPVRYTGDGQDVSPPLKWSGVPDGTKSIALICDDPDAPGGTWVHWVVYDLPADTVSLAEAMPTDATLPDGGLQGVTDFGRTGYGGPAPPPGPEHHYHFRVYALDRPLGLKPGAKRPEVDAAMRGHILAEGVLIGVYRR